MIKKAIQIILGIFMGIVFLYLFIYFGGADYLAAFGRKTEQAGKELKQYEKDVRNSAGKVEDVFEKAKDEVKDRL